MSGVLSEPVEPEVDWDEQGEDGEELAGGEPEEVPEPVPETGE